MNEVLPPPKAGPHFDVPSLDPVEGLDVEELVPAGSGDIELEIGFGKGHFLKQRAQAVPKTRIFGIETRRKWVDLVTQRLAKHSVYNARVYAGDARRIIACLGPDACLSNVFINFPDPWWKARHEKRMVVVPELVREAARLLKDGGGLFVQTDVDFRAEAFLDVLRAEPTLVGEGEDGVISSNPFEAISLREKNCERVKLPITRLLFCRRPR